MQRARTVNINPHLYLALGLTHIYGIWIYDILESWITVLKLPRFIWWVRCTTLNGIQKYGIEEKEGLGMECSRAAGGTKGPVWQRPLFHWGGGGAAYVAEDDGGHFSRCPRRGWTDGWADGGRGHLLRSRGGHGLCMPSMGEGRKKGRMRGRKSRK